MRLLRHPVWFYASVGMNNQMIYWMKRIGPALTTAIVTGIICASRVEPISRTDSHRGRLWLLIAGMGLVIARFAWPALQKKLAGRGRQIVIQGYGSILALLCTVGVFNYYQFDRQVTDGLDDYTDITYYYLNSKYLNELGYFKFYAATLYADLSYNNRHASKIRVYRDLRDYEVKSTQVAFARGKQIAQNDFTQERWAQFQKDVDWFLAKRDTESLQQNFFVDHGYNPPPTWAVAGGLLSNLVPVEQVKSIAMVDVLLVLVMLAGVAVTFGPEASLWVLLFFVTTFSGRWPILSHALLRFDWSVTLLLSMCAFKKERYMLAGGLLSFAAFTRIFPAIFFMAFGVVALRDIISQRRIPIQHLKVVIGAVAVGAVLVGTALAMFGADTFAESAHNLLMHNRSYSSHRVGLGDLMVFRGETTPDEIRAIGGIATKEQAVQALQPTLKVWGGLAILLIGFYMWRIGKPIHDLLYLAIIPFFCFTNPQINYYYVRLPMLLYFAAYIDKPWHKAGLVLLLLVDAVTQYVFLTGVPRYTVTSTTSVGMAVLFVLLLVSMGWELFSTRHAVVDNKATAP